MTEAAITINGKSLSEVQAMVLRVACTHFLEQLASNPDGLGDDEHGRSMTALYRNNTRDLVTMIHQHQLSKE